MILCLECGNTCIKIGFVDDNFGIVDFLMIKTNQELTSDEYALRLKSICNQHPKIKGAIISSVVPKLTNILKLAINKIYGVDAKILNKNLKSKIAIKIDNPSELGSDFICTAVGALKKGYKPPFAIADYGTTTKISVVDQKGNFIGCTITAGIGTSMIALSDKTAQLFEVEFQTPNHIIGKNSKDSIQSGLLYGQAYMVDELIRRIEQELGYKLNRILTGGYSKIIKNILDGYYFEEHLSIIGLSEIYRLNKD